MFFCTGKEGRTDGVVLDSSNICPGKDRAICTKCNAESSKLYHAKERRAKGSRTNNMGRDAAFWKKFFRLLKEKEEEVRAKTGTPRRIYWPKLAPLLDDQVSPLKSAYKATWVDAARRKKCGKCVRCKKGDQCVVDLKTFDEFMKKRPNERFGADAVTGRPAGSKSK